MIPNNAVQAYEEPDEDDVRQSIRQYQQYATEYPVEYAEKCLGVKPWSKQEDILRAFADPANTMISVRSGNGVGKTFLAATLITQYLDTHSPGYAVVTGASWQGVLKTVWPTFRRLHSRAPVNLGGTVLGTEWRRGEMWGAFCVSPDAPENISGFRTENGALIIVDEASSLTPEVYEAILGVCSAEGSKLVLLGNPLRPEGPFFDSFLSHGWKNFHISSIEAAKQSIKGLASMQWIEDRRKEWGEDSMAWKSRVLGDFPEDSEDILIPLSAVGRATIPSILSQRGWLYMGVDVARFGDDRTIITIRDQRCVRYAKAYHGRNLMEACGIVIKTINDWSVRPENVIIDDTGLGGGVTDRLHEQGYSVVPVNFGEAAYEDDKFQNRRSELYWNMRKAIIGEDSKRLFVPQQFTELVRELPWARYSMLSDQRIALEPKDKIKKRHGHSPDWADSLALSFDVYGNYDFA